MTAVIRWEEPPDRKHGHGGYRPVHHRWTAIGKALAQRPNRWALVLLCDNATSAGSVAYQIRRGQYVDLLTIGEFDAVARTIDGEHRLYARYIGGVS